MINPNKSNVFKLRCELVADAFEFLTEFFAQTEGELNHVQIDKDENLSCELTLTTKRSLTFVKNIINYIPDLHCLSETLAPIETYTGIRKINL